MINQDRRRTLCVLVIDDNADAVESTAIILRGRGFAVQTAQSGLEALQLIHYQWPDVVFLDIGQSKLNGPEVAKLIRAQCGQNKKPFFVALSGSGQEPDKLRSRAEGFDLHLVKPVKISELAEHLFARLSA